MYAYIKGSLEEKSSNYVVVETGGIGYKIFMSNIAINNVGEIGDKVKVYTHYYVREDNISLYGFLSNEELRMFELLLQVSGIGAKSAISMLSNISPSSFALAVLTNDINSLKKIPGIGLELQDKMKKETLANAEEMEQVEITSEEESQNVKDAIQALQILGYNKREIDRAFEKIANKDVTTEELIKKGLILLSK